MLIQPFSSSLHLFLILCSEEEQNKDMHKFLKLKIQHDAKFLKLETIPLEDVIANVIK